MADASVTSATPLSARRVLLRLAEHEQAGIDFYTAVMQGTASEWVGKLAQMMIKAEKRHKTRFLSYADRARQATDPSEYTLTGSLSPDLRRLLMEPIFGRPEQAKASARYAGDREMLQVAVRAEEKTALLLGQLRSYVPRVQRPFINRVIKEEWGHKAKLENFLHKYFS